MSRVLECEACGWRSFYEKRRCLECGESDLFVTTPGTGELLAVTTVHVTPEGVREPNELGIASFPSDANVVAQLGQSLSVGDSVALDGDHELRRVEDGTLRGVRLVAAD